MKRKLRQWNPKYKTHKSDTGRRSETNTVEINTASARDNRTLPEDNISEYGPRQHESQRTGNFYHHSTESPARASMESSNGPQFPFVHGNANLKSDLETLKDLIIHAFGLLGSSSTRELDGAQQSFARLENQEHTYGDESDAGDTWQSYDTAIVTPTQCDPENTPRQPAWRFNREQLFNIAEHVGKRQHEFQSFSKTPFQVMMEKRGIRGDLSEVLYGDSSQLYQEREEFCIKCTMLTANDDLIPDVPECSSSLELPSDIERDEEGYLNYAGELLEKSDSQLEDGNIGVTFKHARDALKVLEQFAVSDNFLQGWALFNMGKWMFRRDNRSALAPLEHYTHVREHLKKANDYQGVIGAWQEESRIHLLNGREDHARSVLEEALEFIQDASRQTFLNLTYGHLAYLEAAILIKLCFLICPKEVINLHRIILSSFPDPLEKVHFYKFMAGRAGTSEVCTWLLSEGRSKEAIKYLEILFGKNKKKYGAEDERTIISAAELQIALLAAQEYDEAALKWSWLRERLFSCVYLLRKYFVCASPVYVFLGQHVRALELLHWGITRITRQGGYPKLGVQDSLILEEAKHQVMGIARQTGLPHYAQPAMVHPRRLLGLEFYHKNQPNGWDAITSNSENQAEILTTGRLESPTDECKLELPLLFCVTMLSI